MRLRPERAVKDDAVFGPQHMAGREAEALRVEHSGYHDLRRLRGAVAHGRGADHIRRLRMVVDYKAGRFDPVNGVVAAVGRRRRRERPVRLLRRGDRKRRAALPIERDRHRADRVAIGPGHEHSDPVCRQRRSIEAIDPPRGACLGDRYRRGVEELPRRADPYHPDRREVAPDDVVHTANRHRGELRRAR